MQRSHLFILILLVGIIAISFFFWRRNSISEYVPVEERPLKKVIYASGYVKPVNYLILRSEVSGLVKRIYVREGDVVVRGMPLAELDPRGLPAQIAEIDKKIAQIEERLNPQSDFLTALQREIEIARTNLLDAEAKLKRREALFKEGLISREELENAKKQFEIMKENYNRLKNAYNDTVKGLKTERQVLLEQKRVISAELAKYTIRAPISGVILQKYVEEGDFINALSGENKLFSIGSRHYEVILEVDEEYVGLIRLGQKVYVAFDVYSERLFEGEIFQIIGEVDRSRRSISVKVRLKDAPLIPAMATAEANIVLEERKGLVIPQKALIGEELVEVKGKGKVRIKTGERFGDHVEVLSGLSPGDLVKIRP